MHTPNPYHPRSPIILVICQPCHITNSAPVTIPARTNTIMTIPCALSHSGNYLFKTSKQQFVDHPVQYTPVIINAENEKLPLHFINHSDHEVVIPKHSYVRAMEKVQESDEDISYASTSPEPVSHHVLSDCLAQSDLLPNQRQPLYNVLQENSDVFGSSIANLTSTPLIKHYISTGNAKPIKQRAYRASHHHHKEIKKQVEEILQNGIIKPSVTLQLYIDYWSLNKATIKDSYFYPTSKIS